MSKIFVNVLLAIKESLRIENGNRYTNYQMNISIKIKFTRRQVTIRHARLIVRHNSFNVTKTHVGDTANWKKKMVDLNK